jgi:hypothetical protein
MKRKIFIFILCAFTSGVFFSCQKDDDVVRLPEVKEVKFLPGNERAKLVFQSQLTESTKEIVIFWNNLKDKKMIPVSQNPADSLYEVMIENLAEGDIEFNIYVRDEFDNKSQLKSTRGHIYGSKYQASLKNRFFEKSEINKENATAWFQDSPEGALAFEVEYIDVNNQSNLLSFEPRKNIVTLPNAKGGSKIKYRLLYLPAPNAIDTFRTSWKDVQIGLVPLEEFKLDTKSLSGHHLYNDELGNEHGGSLAALLDGIVKDNNFFHTSSTFENLGKITFTIDLGKKVILSKFIIWPRPFFPDRMMKEFDVWAIDDITDADTEYLQTDVEGWEFDMTSKGWKKVASLTTPKYDGDPRSYNNSNPYSATYLIEEDRDHTYRYVRFLVKSTFDPTKAFNLGEIEVFEKR